MNEKLFIEELLAFGIKISEIQRKQLEDYYHLLIKWNEKINLTAITNKDEVYLKHFYDSLTIAKIVNLNELETMCDIGTGAGFPGLVIKIVFPHLKVTLVDSLRKRITFLNEVIDRLGLDQVTSIHSRAEDFGIKNREKYDLVVARAVAPLSILLEYAVPVIKVSKFFVAMKANISQEIFNSQSAIKKLDVVLSKKEEFLLPIENSNRTLLLFSKEKQTNVKYPRKPNEIKKYPL